jgi:SNF2 family DNA or RNA helicase
MLLPQDMGLGKTLTALALIAGSATTPSDEPATRANTLVVAPLSSMYLHG